MLLLDFCLHYSKITRVDVKSFSIQLYDLNWDGDINLANSNSDPKLTHKYKRKKTIEDSPWYQLPRSMLLFEIFR